MEAKFPMGQTVITKNALERLNPFDVSTALVRHAGGDWGDLCQEDRDLNEEALKDGSRLLSVYVDSLRTKFYVITEADRSVTTVLLPEDY